MFPEMFSVIFFLYLILSTHYVDRSVISVALFLLQCMLCCIEWQNVHRFSNISANKDNFTQAQILLFTSL